MKAGPPPTKPTSVVTYRGSEIGSVKSVDVTQNGVQAVLSLKSDIAIPSDVTAAVHSRSAIGEQFLDLTPHSGTVQDTGPKLRDGGGSGIRATTRIRSCDASRFPRTNEIVVLPTPPLGEITATVFGRVIGGTRAMVFLLT